MCFRENIYTCVIHHISKKKKIIYSAIHTSSKIAYTKMYRSVCVLCVKTMRDMTAKMQDR